jgi:hypothetical protein
MRAGATQATDKVIEDLRVEAVAVMGADDRAALASQLLDVRDRLQALRSKLVRRLRPVSGPRSAAVVRGVLSRLQRIDRVLGVMLACYQEEVGAHWDDVDEVGIAR